MCRSLVSTYSLDHLALLNTHPRATAAAQAAFSAALLTWTRERVAALVKRYGGFQAADEQDLVQAFMLRCLTRHLPKWSASRVALSPYLYRRLQCDVIDALRSRGRHLAQVDVDADISVVVDGEDVNVKRERLAHERRCAAALSVLETLPSVERRLICQTVMGSASMSEIADELGVHPSTMSRHRKNGLRRLRDGLAQAA